MLELESLASVLSVSLDKEKLQLLRRFLLELFLYNQHTNLVARADFPTLVKEHVIDALSLVSLINGRGLLPGKDARLIDIGSGAGFPGIVLAVVLDSLQVDLVDSVGKKTRFLNQEVESLGLGGRVQVHNLRAEVLVRQSGFRETFDLATARAVGPLDLIAELAVPFLKPHGVLLAQKSRGQLDDEIKKASHALSVLGARVGSIEAVDAGKPGKDHLILLIEKVQTTPGRFPRTTAQIARRSLSLEPGV